MVRGAKSKFQERSVGRIFERSGMDVPQELNASRNASDPRLWRLFLEEKRLLVQRRVNPYRRVSVELKLGEVRNKIFEAVTGYPLSVRSSKNFDNSSASLIRIVKQRGKFVVGMSNPRSSRGVAVSESQGLRDAMQFSERLRSGRTRLLTSTESQAAWQESDREMAELLKIAAQKLGAQSSKG